MSTIDHRAMAKGAACGLMKVIQNHGGTPRDMARVIGTLAGGFLACSPDEDRAAMRALLMEMVEQEIIIGTAEIEGRMAAGGRA